MNGEMNGAMRILHCPTITGGNPQNLARAERELGLTSWSVAYSSNYLQYQCDEVLFDSPPALWRQQISSWKLLGRAGSSYDVIHYNGGQSILPWDVPPRLASPGTATFAAFNAYATMCRYVERRILRRKIIAVTYQGDDARQGDVCLTKFPISIAAEVEESYYGAQSDERKRRRISWFDTYADLIYALNPDLLWVLPKRAKFLPYANVDPANWTPVQSNSTGRLLVHAPSHRGAKGTRFVVDAVNRLKSEGVAFDFVLVENLSNAEARKLYEHADLVVDQLLAGWYGGLAVEVMALGKPVICYLRQSDLAFLPDGMRGQLPVIEANPDNIYAVLRDWLTRSRDQLLQRGMASRAFVERWHDPLRIAAGLKADYEQVALRKRESARTPAA